eukprot:TRINITY_DN11330_c0_g1_i6.p1 TRINITY_DN11330_c0_g1~~TRINITY_DN11330_c0_g1_i6.p1  ORF type:complete len:149 (+),score=9.97 TRINITY_DN11330_c0_g1_i6:103-549(+)
MKNTTSIVLGAIINAALACKSDLDCSLNGECMNDSCRYFSAWGGSDCGVLQFKPSLQPAAYSYDPNVTSWDGNIVYFGAPTLRERGGASKRRPHRNGTWYLVCNGGTFHMYRADNFSGPYEHVVDLPSPAPNTGTWEDPFLYMDHADN